MKTNVVVTLLALVTVQAVRNEKKQTSDTGGLIIHEVGGFQFPLEKSINKLRSRSATTPSSGAHDQTTNDGVRQPKLTDIFKKLPNWMKLSTNTPETTEMQ